MQSKSVAYFDQQTPGHLKLSNTERKSDRFFYTEPIQKVAQEPHQKCPRSISKLPNSNSYLSVAFGQNFINLSRSLSRVTSKKLSGSASQPKKATPQSRRKANFEKVITPKSDRIQVAESSGAKLDRVR